MTREEAIKILKAIKVYECYPKSASEETKVAIDMAIEALSAEAEPKMTEEVREALMRLAMCAREECGMCKYKDECGFDFQYKISTDNMNTLADALLRSKCEVDAKSADAVEVVRCKDCRMTRGRDEHIWRWWCFVHQEYMADDYYCADGKRREDGEDE